MRLIHVVDGVRGLGGRQTYADEFCRRADAGGWANHVCMSTDLQDDPGVIDRFEPDAVVLHTAETWQPVLDVCGGAVPCVAWVHNHDPYCPGGMSWFPRTGAACDRHAGPGCAFHAYRHRCAPREPRRLNAMIRSSSASMALTKDLTCLFVGSAYMQARLAGTGVGPSKIELVPYFPKWDPPPTPPPRQADGGRPLIFCPSRLHPTKGVEQLIEALAFVSTPSELVVAGMGLPDYTSSLEALARRAPARHQVRIVDEQGDSIAARYLASTVVVVPSAWPEPFGLVGLEAMAFARPLVAFDVGGVADWLADGEVGSLVAAGDVRGLGEAIEALVADPVAREAMGAAGLERVRARFSWSLHLSRFEAALRRRLGLADGAALGRQV